MNVEGGIQPGDLGEIVRRRGKLVFGAALLATLVAYWVAMALPNEYMSYATILVEPQSVDPGIVESGIQASDLGQRLNLMTAQILSRGRLSRIIDELGLYEDESKYMVREQVIDIMRDQVSVEPVIPELAVSGGNARSFEINTFKIIFHDDRARVARDVAQRLANDFIESHIEARVNVSQKSVDFIEVELQRLADRIGQVEAQVAKVKAENGGRLPEDLSANQRRMERLMADLSFAQRRMAEAQSDEAFYRTQAASTALADRSNDPTSPSRRVQLLELQLAEFKALGLTEKHPDVIKTQIEIEQIREQLQSLEESEKDDGDTTSIAQQNAQAAARRAALQKEAAQEEIDRLQAQIEDVQALLFETPQVAEKLDALQREYRHLFESYQSFSNKRLEATVQAQLELRQLGEQFRVLEPAFVAPAPSSPNRPMIVLLGLVFGVVLGGGVGLLLESLDGSVHNARQLQASLQIPVLASIPEIWLEADQARQRRSRIRIAIGTAALVAFVLVGGAGSYVWVNGGARSESRAVAPAAAPAAPEAASAPAPPADGEG